jgi:hypothetical protein
MKKYQIIGSLLLVFALGVYFGGMEDLESKEKSQDEKRALSYEVDSLRSELIMLKISIGRYEIASGRLQEKYPEIEREVFGNLE